MVSFCALAAGALLLFGCIAERLGRAIRTDSLEYDMQYLWENYDVTPEQMRFKKS